MAKNLLKYLVVIILKKTIQKLLLFLFLTAPVFTLAHNASVCKTVIRKDADTHKWYVLVTFNAEGAITSLENDNPSLKDNYKNDLLWKQAFVKYVKKHLQVTSSNGELKVGYGLVNIGSNFEAILELEKAPKDPSFFEVENSGLLDAYPNQTNIVTVLNGNETFEALITKDNNKQIVYLNHSFKNQCKVFFEFLVQGLRHVLPLGLDHILFIVALFFLNSNLKSSVIQASMFTLSHSITLIITGLGFISPNPAIIEPIIAASILLIAVENLFNQQVNKWRMVLIFLFGLIHGLGFANAFLSLQIPSTMSLIALVAFNVGIEIAQISIILGLYYFLVKWVKQFNWYQFYFVKGISIAISITALIWTMQRYLNT